VDEYQRQAAAIKARIASLRGRLARGLESFEGTQAQRIQDTTERLKETKRVEPRVEPDWDAINKNIAINDEREARENDLAAIRAKFKK
jgi:hypothetical protein|tara:strand:+ start:81 stop:344 length:264 start_codon:yes stop_codon:yes gene_type:complete